LTKNYYYIATFFLRMFFEKIHNGKAS